MHTSRKNHSFDEERTREGCGRMVAQAAPSSHQWHEVMQERSGQFGSCMGVHGHGALSKAM